MTKQELVETYTAEQLAEMVENLQKENLVELLKMKNREDTEDVSKVLDAMKLTITELCNTIEDLQSENIQEKRKHAKTLWEYCDSVKKADYDSEVNRLQSEVEKYRNAFENVKKERDCQIAEYQKKIEELYNSLQTLEGNLKVENVIIENTIKNENGEKTNTIKFDGIKQFAEYIKCFFTVNLDYINKFLRGYEKKKNAEQDITCSPPTEPIKVADMLIDNAMKSYDDYVGEFAKTNSGKLVGLNLFDNAKRQTFSYLRQIAEHLLVYCNHNEDGEQ